MDDTRPDPSAFDAPVRLDKWLWSVRVFKTRPEATATCRNDRVAVNGLVAKPGRDVHVGEVVTVRVGMVTRTLKVLGRPRSRVGARQLPEYLADLTPPGEYEKAQQARLEHLLARERGKGRPTKKERREMGSLFGFE
ncbi:MAG: RNA-binding S4 domain-containing protein [Opitutae bacterium]|nr:RNA-binding S4 domain-containing protein [Opitutae bacterium]